MTLTKTDRARVIYLAGGGTVRRLAKVLDNLLLSERGPRGKRTHGAKGVKEHCA